MANVDRAQGAKPWWKEPTRDQWMAYIAAWLGNTAGQALRALSKNCHPERECNRSIATAHMRAKGLPTRHPINTISRAPA